MLIGLVLDLLSKPYRCQRSRKGRTVVSYDNDIDAAMQVHLLQAVHQLTNDVIQLPQRVVQL